MIRFIVGMFLVLGSVGGLEMDTMGFGEFFLWSSIGLTSMFFGVKKINYVAPRGATRNV